MSITKFTSLLLVSIIFLILLTTLSACNSESYGDGYNKGYEEGYSRGWQEGYDEGLNEVSSLQSQTLIPITTPDVSLGKLTLEDAEYIINLLPLLPLSFEELDPATEGMSNADLGLGDDFSEVKVYLSDEPFQMIWGMMGICYSRIESSSFDSVMNDEEMIKALLIDSIEFGIVEEGFRLEDVDTVINITYPDIGDSAFLGEGFVDVIGLSMGVDIIWFRVESVYIMFYSVYYSSEKTDILPLAIEMERRVNQYSQ